jgi:hypothetical protein
MIGLLFSTLLAVEEPKKIPANVITKATTLTDFFDDKLDKELEDVPEFELIIEPDGGDLILDDLDTLYINCNAVYVIPDDYDNTLDFVLTE